MSHDPDKLSDDSKTHEVMSAVKEVLDTYARSKRHLISYEMVEEEGTKTRQVTIRVRVPAR